MIAEYAVDHVTRFDVAIDFVTDVTPLEFITAGISDRIQSRSLVESATGQTCYIGSPTSDMMARVYRYEPPHERAGKTRVEFVARRKRAKIALQLWLSEGPIAAVAFMAKAFEFKHELWQSGRWHGAVVDATVEHTRSEQKTIAWLLKQVKPALYRLSNEDSLDQAFWDEFLGVLPHVSVTYKKEHRTVRETVNLPVSGEGPDRTVPWDNVL
jgi:DNA relaxase NicK